MRYFCKGDGSLFGSARYGHILATNFKDYYAIRDDSIVSYMDKEEYEILTEEFIISLVNSGNWMELQFLPKKIESSGRV